ncbi:Molybdenum cofactor sulfurase [Zostera marina]|uniref:Molybdenum cofactor sulfurase n=1 Tax=Zostera marina TaxID=29655 RepID=A0A0K9P7N3_ZOSMR|nr:Molybdenum cofactor sulfurase [Zostera marina]
MPMAIWKPVSKCAELFTNRKKKKINGRRRGDADGTPQIWKLHEMKIREALEEASEDGSLVFVSGDIDPNGVIPEPENETINHYSRSRSLARLHNHHEFLRSTAIAAESTYETEESLSELDEAFSMFLMMYPAYKSSEKIDELRFDEYPHLTGSSAKVCLDYCGFGLFSFLQYWESTSFRLSEITANLGNYALYSGNDEGTVEYCIKRRIMEYLNVSESDYGMVFTASRGSAFKLLAESYPFQSNKHLLTMFDHESQSVNWMKSRAKEKGAHVSNAWFKWPTLKICSSDLTKQISSAYKRKRGRKDSAVGLFAFPVQSRVTGTKYSYQWMSLAQKNNWHVLLDAGSLGPNDMDSLGLSLFRPDFIITSFYRVFGSDPTGFGCLLIRKSAIATLGKENGGIGSGMVKIIPVDSPYTGGLSDNVDDELENKTVMNEDDGIQVSDHRRESDMPVFSGAYTSTEVMEVCETEERNQVNYYGGSDQWDETDNVSVGEIMKSPILSDEDETDGASFWINLGHSPMGSPADTRYSDDANPPPWFVTRKNHPITTSSLTSKPIDRLLSFDSAVLSISQKSNNFHHKDPEESPDRQTSDLNLRNMNNSNTVREIEEIIPDDDGRENAIIRREPDGGEFRLLDGRDGTTSAVNRFFASEENNGDRSTRHRVSFVTDEHRSNSVGGSSISDANSGNAEAGTSSITEPEFICKHLDHVTMMGLNKTTLRLRYLTNWLVTSLLQLRIPDPTGEENDHVPLVYIYGPKIKYERGSSLALNIKDRRQPNRPVINPETVQNLAEKNGISLGVGFLSHVEIPETARKIHGDGSGNSNNADENHQQRQQKRRKSNKRREFGSPIRLQVVTVSLGFLTNFTDVHSFWTFVAKFLNPSFVTDGTRLSTIVETSDV